MHSARWRHPPASSAARIRDWPKSRRRADRMPNKSYVGLVNLVDTATLKNGTGGAPALDQTSPYTMSKVITPDRYTIWKTGSPPGGSPINLDLDLGSDKTVTAVGIFGYRPAPSGTAATSLKVFAVNNAAGYPPGAGWGAAKATMNGIAGSPRDIGALISSVSA